jgi:hypothetical protein
VKKVYLCMAWSPGSLKKEACSAFDRELLRVGIGSRRRAERDYS